MNIGLYARKSNYKDNSDSTKMQLDVGRKYSLEHLKGPHTFFEYEDDGYVRTNVNRPDYKRMMADVDSKLLDVIVLWKFDRISGDMKDFCMFYSHLVERGVRLVVVTENIDTTTPLGEAMMYIAVVFAQLEVANDSERVTENMLNLAREGFWTGGPAPIGYEIVKIPYRGKEHKSLEIVPSEVEWKMNLIKIFLDGKFSLQGFETYCKHNEIRSLRGAFLSTTQFYNMINTAACVAATPAMYDYYASKGCMMSDKYPREKWDGKHGIILYGRTSQKKGKHVLASPDNWTVSIGKHEPYIDDATFFRIQDQLARNKFEKKKKYDIPLLKGVIRCSCGCLMQVARKKNTNSVSSYYYCLKRMRKGIEYCSVGHTNIKYLDEKVMEIFKNIAYDESAIDKYIGAAASHNPEKSSAQLLRQLDSIKSKLNNLASALSKNEESAASKYIIEEMERLDLQYQDVNRQLLTHEAEARIQKKNLRGAETKKEEIRELLENFDRFSADERNEIVKSVLKECVWDGTTLSVTL